MLLCYSEKWTLFDEATRVPLIIHHPLSPFKGQHYKHPVELIDVFPTVLDLLQVPTERVAHCASVVSDCTPLQGKSLAPVVLGNLWGIGLKKQSGRKLESTTDTTSTSERNIVSLANLALSRLLTGPAGTGEHGDHHRRHVAGHNFTVANDVQFAHDFSLTQFWRCLKFDELKKINSISGVSSQLQGYVSP
jgi:hypothetical protein